MEYSAIFTLIAVSCVGSFIQRVSGFGFGIFVMTVFPFFLPSYGESTALSGLLAGSMSLLVALRLRKFIVWKEVLPILTVFAIVSYFAIGAVTGLDQKLLKHILGATLVIISVYFFFVSEKIKLKPTLAVQVILGVISGLMGGFFAMQGPPAVLYFLASANTKEKYQAQGQVYFVLGNTMMTIFRARAGFVTKEVGIAYACCILAVTFGAFIGTKVLKKISLPILRKIVYAYMAVSGTIALLS